MLCFKGFPSLIFKVTNQQILSQLRSIHLNLPFSLAKLVSFMLNLHLNNEIFAVGLSQLNTIFRLCRSVGSKEYRSFRSALNGVLTTLLASKLICDPGKNQPASIYSNMNLRSFISNLIDHIRASIQSLPVAHQWTGDGHLLQPVGILESQQLVG
jgi:hypothetical protein